MQPSSNGRKPDFHSVNEEFDSPRLHHFPCWASGEVAGLWNRRGWIVTTAGNQLQPKPKQAFVKPQRPTLPVTKAALRWDMAPLDDRKLPDSFGKFRPVFFFHGRWDKSVLRQQRARHGAPMREIQISRIDRHLVDAPLCAVVNDIEGAVIERDRRNRAAVDVLSVSVHGDRIGSGVAGAILYS